MNPRLQVMLDSRQIEARPADDREVAGTWEKAVRTLVSSEVPDLDADSAFTLAYQAALQASTAVVRAAGYRVRGEGHHHHTFAAVAALAPASLAAAARDLNVIRQQRHGAVYDWETRLEESDLVELREAAGRLFHAARPWLAGERPGLADRLHLPPGGTR